ncbi:MAG: hypothetical protein K9G67_09155 [Bacteroidales bacterium]|nr:hypothetical protein [Bacteroidales bacterium]MCF8351518.1 hypothetical protein [Bacteroidales bacterium]MCF8376509.1 hypothetical protein [Bacteroidales bacterium]
MLKHLIHFKLLVSLFMIANTGLAQWEWQNPLPQGNPIVDLHLISMDTAIFVGDCGTIIKTTDGCESLDVYQCGTRLNFKSVHFPDSHTGYAVCGTGAYSGYDSLVVYKTTNVGESWTKVFADDKGLASSIFFFDKDTGFIAGYDGLILKSTDGGNSWITLDGNTTKELRQITFTNADTGIAIGAENTLIRTTDGGNSWKNISTPAPVGTFLCTSFPNDQIGYLLAHNHWGDNTILKTENAGEDWFIINGGSKLTTMTYLDFINCDTGFVFGYGDAIRTYDGGQSWQYDNTIFLYSGGKIDFWDFNRAYRIDGNSVYYGGPRIRRTNDNGDTWNDFISYSTLSELDDLEFPSLKTGYAADAHLNASGILLKTNDGENWFKILEFQTDTGFSKLNFLDENHGVVGLSVKADYPFLNQKMIYKTSNGGQTWTTTKVGEPDDGYFINSISYPHQSTCFVTDIYNCYRSTDSCMNWEKIYVDSLFTEYKVHQVIFPSKNTGYLVISSETEKSTISEIFKTTDSGESWESVLQLAGGYPPIMFFVNEEIGFILKHTNAFYLHKTLDGGNSWISIPVNYNIRIRKMHFLDQYTGFLHAGDEGFLKTTDGGISWTQYEQVTNNNLMDFFL